MAVSPRENGYKRRHLLADPPTSPVSLGPLGPCPRLQPLVTGVNVEYFPLHGIRALTLQAGNHLMLTCCSRPSDRRRD